MVAGTLYTYPGYFRGFKATVAAAYSGFELNTVELAAGDKRAQVPSFESADKKLSLFDSNSIAYYVANDQFRGTTNESRAEVLQWLNYGSENVVPAVSGLVYPCLSLVESCPAGLKKAESELRQVFGLINDFLKTRTYLVGQRMTLADVSLACDLLLAYRHVADEKFRKPYGNLNRWFLTVMNQDNVKKVCGELSLCNARPEFCADKHKKHTEAAKAAAPAKKEKAPKPAKEAPKKKAPEPEEEMDEAEEAMAAEPKSKDPFAEMPKGTFNMDEFKRIYSNEDTDKTALPYFWKNFEENKEFYSIWYCEYKYPEDLSKVFMTSNLIGGFFQRIEKLRKNSFCNMGVYGVDGKNTIAGVWFWKGQDLVFPMNTDWTVDYESYEWKKLDLANPEHKKLLNENWQWEGEIKGMKFNAGKTFK
jgi:elongation factor 1-gamma